MKLSTALQLSPVLAAFAIFLAGGLNANSAIERPSAQAAEIGALPEWKSVLDNPCWNAKTATVLTLVPPSNVNFANSPETTQIKLLWCKDYLLVRFDCEDKSIVYLPGSTGLLPPRDLPYFKADAVEIFLDPVGDSRMYMEFQFSPNNGVFDAAYFCTTAPQSESNYALTGDVVNRNLFFLPEWNLKGLQTSARIWPGSAKRGWSVVAAFPASEILKRLGAPTFSSGMKFKINFVRFDYFIGNQQPVEITNWSPVLGGCAHISPQGMGTITLAH